MPSSLTSHPKSQQCLQSATWQPQTSQAFERFRIWLDCEFYPIRCLNLEFPNREGISYQMMLSSMSRLKFGTMRIEMKCVTPFGKNLKHLNYHNYSKFRLGSAANCPSYIKSSSWNSKPLASVALSTDPIRHYQFWWTRPCCRKYFQTNNKFRHII